MNLTPDTFLILNAAFVILVVASYVFVRRGSRPPVRLRMNGKRSEAPAPPTPAIAPRKKISYDQIGMEDLDGDLVPARREKSLNIIFNYNGHSWDAFEVLGVPAGSSKEAVQQAYQKMHGSVETDSREFVQAAYDAIMKKSS